MNRMKNSEKVTVKSVERIRTRLSAWLCGAVAGVAVLLTTSPVQAQVYATHLYTGDAITDGLSVNVDTNSDFRTVHIDSLTSSATPVSGPGVAVLGIGGVDLTLTFDGLAFGAITFDAPALLVSTVAVSGEDGAASLAGTDGEAGGSATVNFLSGFVYTSGDNAPGVQAESFGGNGGNGGAGDNGAPDLDGDAGGSGGSGGDGGAVTVNNNAGITTSGNNSPGIRAQSFGGTGGNGGNGGDGGGPLLGNGATGGDGGNGGHGGLVTVQNHTNIAVVGLTGSAGIRADSIGGTGGNGGNGGA